MKRQYIFFGLACFCFLGFLTMLGEDIIGAIFYLIVALIFCYFSRDFIIAKIKRVPMKRKGETDIEYEKRIAVVKAKMAEEKKLTEELKLKQKEEAEEQRKLQEIEDRKWFNIAVGKLAINEEESKIKINGENYNYSDIVGSEIIIDEDTISISHTTGKNKKKVALGKAAVGGLLLGPVGALIGGTSGKTKVNTKTTTENTDFCDKLQIRVDIDNIKNPFIYVDFITSRTNKNSNNYQIATLLAQKCYSSLQLITNKNKKD
jgi:hypothetical protein